MGRATLREGGTGRRAAEAEAEELPPAAAAAAELSSTMVKEWMEGPGWILFMCLLVGV